MSTGPNRLLASKLTPLLILQWSFLIAALISPSSRAQTENFDHVELSTDHFKIRMGPSDIPHVDELLEQIYGRLSQFFGEEPESRLQIIVFDSRSQFEAELEKIGSRYAGTGIAGLYRNTSNTIYLWHQDQLGLTRESLLHEVTHAFLRTVSDTAASPPNWFVEGLAEYFEHHCWDGDSLQVGSVPLISLENRPALALAAFGARDQYLHSTLFGTSEVHRYEAWAIVHFLMTHYPEELKLFAFTEGEPRDVWESIFGALTHDFVEEYHSHLQSIQQPWTIIQGNWTECKGVLTASSGGSSIALLKQTPKAVTVRITPRPGSKRGGVVAAFRSVQDHSQLTVDQNGNLRLDQRSPGRPTYLQFLRNQTVVPDPSFDLTAKQLGSKWRLFIEGKLAAKVRGQDRFGVVAVDGPISFQVLDLESRPRSVGDR